MVNSSGLEEMIIQKLVPTYKCKWHPRHMNANFSNKSADKCSSLEAFPCIYIRPSSKRLFIQICHQDIQNHAILSKVSSINTAGLISRSCVSECVGGDYSADMRCLGGAGVSGVCREPPEKEDQGFMGGLSLLATGERCKRRGGLSSAGVGSS